jgi:hypothetical protein
MMATAGWVRDKLTKAPRLTKKLNIVFNCDTNASMTSKSLGKMIKQFEKFE